MGTIGAKGQQIKDSIAILIDPVVLIPTYRITIIFVLNWFRDAAILKNYQISGVDTANIEDFEGLTFLEAINPLISIRRARSLKS